MIGINADFLNSFFPSGNLEESLISFNDHAIYVNG